MLANNKNEVDFVNFDERRTWRSWSTIPPTTPHWYIYVHIAAMQWYCTTNFLFYLLNNHLFKTGAYTPHDLHCGVIGHRNNWVYDISQYKDEHICIMLHNNGLQNHAMSPVRNQPHYETNTNKVCFCIFLLTRSLILSFIFHVYFHFVAAEWTKNSCRLKKKYLCTCREERADGKPKTNG